MIKKICLLAPNPEKWVQVAKSDVALALAQAGFELSDEATLETDLCLCIGGDGSLLAGIRRLGDIRKSLLISGVHFSRGLGFLHPVRLPDTSKEIQDWAHCFRRCIEKEQFIVQKRWGLEATIEDSNLQTTPQKLWAMNDIVFSKGRLSRMIKLRVSVNDTVLFHELRGDGLIAASATGSTAYSLSAGGPVVSPEMATILLTPVCPHEIAQRPIVLDENAKVEIEVLESKTTCFLTEDGQEGNELVAGQKVLLQRSPSPVNWWIPQSPELNSKNYFELLRDKLGFGRSQSHVD